TFHGTFSLSSLPMSLFSNIDLISHQNDKSNGLFHSNSQRAKNIDEHIYRTPSPGPWRSIIWPVHCDDFCEFIGRVVWDDIVRMGIEEEIEKDLSGNPLRKDHSINEGEGSFLFLKLRPIFVRTAMCEVICSVVLSAESIA
ncbi:MAG: CbrC family protein, partial [Methanomassiliicoccaceae archaeon]|nr:CbrC family protein [Methanomassiliicoccaceae archaeon]